MVRRAGLFGYDTVLLGLVFWQTLKLLRPAPGGCGGTLPAATIIVAAHNEVGTLPITLAALLAQDQPGGDRADRR